jgi:hypothetical protein
MAGKPFLIGNSEGAAIKAAPFCPYVILFIEFYRKIYFFSFWGYLFLLS